MKEGSVVGLGLAACVMSQTQGFRKVSRAEGSFGAGPFVHLGRPEVIHAEQYCGSSWHTVLHCTVVLAGVQLFLLPIRTHSCASVKEYAQSNTRWHTQQYSIASWHTLQHSSSTTVVLMKVL